MLVWQLYQVPKPFKSERAQKTLELCYRYGVMDQEYMTLKSPQSLKKKKLLLGART